MASTISVMEGKDQVPESTILTNLKISCQKTKLLPASYFGTLMGRISLKLQPRIDLSDSVALVKSL